MRIVTLLIALAGACSAEVGVGTGRDDAGTPSRPSLPEPSPVTRDPIAPAEQPPGRSIRRLTAEQLRASLRVATGEEWTRFEQYASSLGRADLAEIVEEGREISVTFERLAAEAARATCHAAIAADEARAGTPTAVLLRNARLSDRTGAPINENLKYLLLRFHGFSVTSDADRRLAPWRRLLEAPAAAGTTLDDASMKLRWEAVCIGLATHPDFLTY